MQLRFLDFTLDTASRTLYRGDTPQTVARRTLDCLAYLASHGERAVSRDELIDALWQREDVSYNQLAQLVTAVRQLLNDDGHTQRAIRTVPGYGYHWVLPVQEAEVSAAAGHADARAPGAAGASTYADAAACASLAATANLPPAPPGLAKASAAVEYRRLRRPIDAGVSRYLLSSSVLVLLLSAWVAGNFSPERGALTATLQAPATISIEDLASKLRQGDFASLARQLSELPPPQASAPQARLLATDLDLRRGRWPAARARIERDLREARAVGDLGWQASLLVRKTKLLMYSGAEPSEALTVSNSAIELIESGPTTGLADSVLAEVWRARGRALLAAAELDPALRDLSHARELFLQARDPIGAADTSGSMARAWLRHGRLSEALAQLLENAELYAAEGDPFSETLELNTAVRLQVELLRWDEAMANSDRAIGLLPRLPGSERQYRTRQLRVWPLLGLGRLREATALLEELGYEQGGRDLLLLAQFDLASGRPEAALSAAAAAFTEGTGIASDPGDVLYETREGGLLLWLQAARAIVDGGGAQPQLPAGAREELDSPRSSLGRIARGQWLLLGKDSAGAVEPLRQALSEARAMNQGLRMRLAAEPLIAALLRLGDIGGAARVLAELRAHDPLRFDGDFRTAELRVRVLAAQSLSDSLKPACRRAMALAGERPLSAEIEAICHRGAGG